MEDSDDAIVNRLWRIRQRRIGAPRSRENCQGDVLRFRLPPDGKQIGVAWRDGNRGTLQPPAEFPELFGAVPNALAKGGDKSQIDL